MDESHKNSTFNNSMNPNLQKSTSPDNLGHGNVPGIVMGVADQPVTEVFLPPKSNEEKFVHVLERINTNARYLCPTCRHIFTGGNQKIRVHITGVKEGGSSVRACPNPDPEALAFCSIPRNRPYKKKAKDENNAGSNKKSRDNPKGPFLNYNEAWELLRNPAKHISIAPVRELAPIAPTAPEPTDGSSGSSTRDPQPMAAFESIVLPLLEEYGVERPEDLTLLDPIHIYKLAEVFKVVPRKLFLEHLGVSTAKEDVNTTI